MARSFAQQLDDIINNRRDVSREVFAGACIQLADKIITRTPVDTGRARGNWNASINQPDDDTSDTRRAGQAQADARQTATTVEAGQTFYLVNGLPYILRLEYGYSRQAPQGMVRLTAEEFRQAVRVALRNAQ